MADARNAPEYGGTTDFWSVPGAPGTVQKFPSTSEMPAKWAHPLDQNWPKSSLGEGIFSAANFAETDFGNANLTDAVLGRHPLGGVCFGGADLRGAKLDNANLLNAYLV